MTQDHIKLRWLIDYLDKIDILKQYLWDAYTDEDSSASCINPNDPYYAVDVTYDILIHIKEYTRPVTELRRILLHWLDAANPQPHQQINILYNHIDTDKKDLLISMEVTEIQQDIPCEESEAEGSIALPDGSRQWVKLDRHPPDELTELTPPITKSNP